MSLASTEQSLSKLLDDVLRDLNYASPNIQITPISSEGANYTSTLFSITVSQQAKETLHLFAKASLMSDNFREAIDLNTFFKLEKMMYQHMSKRFENIQDKYKVPEEMRPIFPKFYGCSTEKDKEILLLQNMKMEGYEEFDRFNSVTWDEAAAAIETLARFHALSFAYQKEDPKEYEFYTKDLKHFDQMENKDGRSLLNVMYDTGFEGLKDKYKKKVEDLIGTNASAKLKDLTKANDGPAGLIHGDYRPSNMLLKKQGSNLQIIVLDYQLLENGRPTIDLVYFITLGTDGRFRAQHHDQLLDHYYRELCAAMRRLDVDPDEVYPREQFDSDWKATLPASLIFACAILPLVLVEASAAPQLGGDVDIGAICVSPTQPLIERLEEICNDLARWGVL